VPETRKSWRFYYFVNYRENHVTGTIESAERRERLCLDVPIDVDAGGPLAQWDEAVLRAAAEARTRLYASDEAQ